MTRLRIDYDFSKTPDYVITNGVHLLCAEKLQFCWKREIDLATCKSAGVLLFSSCKDASAFAVAQHIDDYRIKVRIHNLTEAAYDNVLSHRL